MSASVGNMWFSNGSSLVLTAMLTAAFVPFGDSFSTLRVAHHDISLRKAPSLVLKMISPEKGGKVNGDAVGVYGASDIVHFGGVADILDFVLEEHKPLGCSADESLADEPDGSKHVFVSKIVEGGNAEKAGIRLGDVFVGVSGTFGGENEVTLIVGQGLDKTRALISGRSAAQSLSLKMARGTDVMERHESALVDLCIIDVDTDVDNCINEINTYGMDFAEDELTAGCGDEETECLLDQMYKDWGDEMAEVGSAGANGETKSEEEETKPKRPAPWSSRSSPSGTFVRNPKTGKMENIDY